MKNYNEPKIIISKLDTKDIITNSEFAPWNEGGDGDGISRPGDEIFSFSDLFGK